MYLAFMFLNTGHLRWKHFCQTEIEYRLCFWHTGTQFMSPILQRMQIGELSMKG